MFENEKTAILNKRDISKRELNKMLPVDSAAHDWYRFVLSFPPHLVRDYVERFGTGSDGVILDPFCGTGTTLVECKRLGVGSVGIEANPMAHLASSVKVNWEVAGEELRSNAWQIAEHVIEVLNHDGVHDDPAGLPFVVREGLDPQAGILKKLPPDEEKLILKNSISPRPLHKILRLRDAIEHMGSQISTPYLRLALAKTLVYSASNLNFGPEVGVGIIKTDTPVISPWLANVSRMSKDMEYLHTLRAAKSEVALADSREMQRLLARRSIDGVITSPPYPNEKDYTRTTRLESVILGFIRSKADLRSLKTNLIRSNTRNVYKVDTDDQWISQFPKILKIAEDIEKRRIELGKTSGFERLYARVTKLYFGGMARHLAELRPLLKSGARLAYVVGDQASYLQIMIRTGSHLAEIADSLGYTVEGIDLFRTRLATATRQQLREEVVLLRWKR